MSKFKCQQSWRTLATKVGSPTACCYSGLELAQAQAACSSGIPGGD